MTADNNNNDDETRRDFLQLTAGAFGAVGAALVAAPLVNSLNPSKDTMALATIEVDISGLEPGQSTTKTWQGKPIFIRRRTRDEIEEARAVDIAMLPDKETDEERVQREEWLITIGICTHLGCIPVGQKITENRGDFGGYFCPCHGSHYDTSGRIRKGPAPRNLDLPPYEFVNDTTIKIG